MTKKKLTISAIPALVAVVCGWYYYSTYNENAMLSGRAIPEKAQLLQAIEDLANGNKNHQQYVESLRAICRDNPVDMDLITNRLKQAGLNIPDSVTISDSPPQAIGEFKINVWQITGSSLTPAQLDALLFIADTTSHLTPKVKIHSSEKIDAIVTIYVLTQSQPKDI